MLASTASGCGPGRPAPSAQSALLSRPLPEVQRRALDGSLVDTRAERGSVVVVKFFADYCEPCKRTLPAAQRLHEAYPDVRVIGVGEDERRSTVESVVERNGLTFPVIHDRENVIAGKFRVVDMPVVFVADPAGVVRWVGDERHTDADLERAVVAVR